MFVLLFCTITLSAQTTQSQSGQSGGASSQSQPKYTKEQIEAIKQQNEKVTKMNVLIQQANTAISAGNWQDAATALQQLATLDPTNWQVYSGLGDAQLHLNQYEQAVDSFKKGIQAGEAITEADPHNPSTDPAKRKAGLGKMLTNEGNALLKLGQNKQAIDCYTKAAAIDPNPAVAYFNLCAAQYNTGLTDEALEACDKAINADPTKADAYFIKGSLLMTESTTDASGKVTAPPGCVEALNKYLELAPNGPHVKDVKEMLDYIGPGIAKKKSK
jgi:tetratricopeptide (TPR) repeat protein